jgi:CheY-like chemotaxis protein
MSTQLQSDLKSTAPTIVSRTAQSPFGAKDLTLLAATLSPVALSARETLVAAAPDYQPEFREDLAQYVRAALLETDVIDADIAPGNYSGPASARKAAGLKARTAPRAELRTSEGCQDDLASVEGLTVALRGARDRSEAARCPLLTRAQRDLREPLTAMLRLTSDWNVQGTDMVAVRMVERQRQALEVMADLIDSFLTIAESEIVRQAALLAELASRSTGGKLCATSATPKPCTEGWSAPWSMISTADCPEVSAALGPASLARHVLLIDEDQGVLGALRIYLLCAGYRVCAAANAGEGLDRARMATSLIDIIIANLDLTGEDDGLAVIDKARQLLGYNIPAILLTTQTSMEIGKPALLADVSLLRNPVNLDELNALIGEVLKRPRRARLVHLRTTDVMLGHVESNLEVVC